MTVIQDVGLGSGRAWRRPQSCSAGTFYLLEHAGFRLTKHSMVLAGCCVSWVSPNVPAFALLRSAHLRGSERPSGRLPPVWYRGQSLPSVAVMLTFKFPICSGGIPVMVEKHLKYGGENWKNPTAEVLIPNQLRQRESDQESNQSSPKMTKKRSS